MVLLFTVRLLSLARVGVVAPDVVADELRVADVVPVVVADELRVLDGVDELLTLDGVADELLTLDDDAVAAGRV